MSFDIREGDHVTIRAVVTNGSGILDNDMKDSNCAVVVEDSFGPKTIYIKKSEIVSVIAPELKVGDKVVIRRSNMTFRTTMQVLALALFLSACTNKTETTPVAPDTPKAGWSTPHMCYNVCPGPGGGRRA